ncbi:MAG TPA: chemotaxis protein CheW [Polyangiaceae bacterium]|nr:chemotaxis protein CheW [Polyangiaceae bacterium]
MTLQRYRHDPSKNLVGFVVGEVEYAVAIARVKEIANPLPLVALPHAPRAVVGVADYRGEVVPVVDLRLRFGLPASEATRKTKWIVVDVGAALPERVEGASVHTVPTRPPESADKSAPSGKLLALVVDAVTDVFSTGGSELREAPTLGGGDDVRGIAGVAAHNGAMAFVLDPARLRDVAAAVAAAAAAIAPGARMASLPPRMQT